MLKCLIRIFGTFKKEKALAGAFSEDCKKYHKMSWTPLPGEELQNAPLRHRGPKSSDWVRPGLPLADVRLPEGFQEEGDQKVAAECEHSAAGAGRGLLEGVLLRD